MDGFELDLRQDVATVLGPLYGKTISDGIIERVKSRIAHAFGIKGYSHQIEGLIKSALSVAASASPAIAEVAAGDRRITFRNVETEIWAAVYTVERVQLGSPVAGSIASATAALHAFRQAEAKDGRR